MHDYNLIGVGTAANRLFGQNAILGYATVKYASTIVIDFNGPALIIIETLTGNLTLTTLNRGGPVKVVGIKVLADSSARNFTLPAWIPIGDALPTSIAANKTARFTLECYGPNDTDVVCAYAVQP